MNAVPLGSSPRMRGTRLASSNTCSNMRIIPADAGNTHHLPSIDTTGGDHPRGCGEHRKIDGLYRHTQGSSPRMRGTPPVRIVPASMTGIIPADAGNTFSFPSSYGVHGDHPRGCGEHRLHRQPKTMARGSSPRMRGTHRFRQRCKLGHRIIPADAGNTFVLGLIIINKQDHPRGCGEHHRYG